MGRAAPIDRYAAPGSADRTQTRARGADRVSGRTLSALDAARRRARPRRAAAYRHGENHEDAAARVVRDAGAAGRPISDRSLDRRRGPRIDRLAMAFSASPAALRIFIVA